MIPVIGLLLCGYIIVRMVEIVSAKDRRTGLLEVLALLMVLASLAAGFYFASAGGLADALETPPSPIITDTTTTGPAMDTTLYPTAP